MVYKITFHHPYFLKQPYDTNGEPRQIPFLENMIRGLLPDDTTDFINHELFYMVTRAETNAAEVFLVYPNNTELNMEFIDRVVDYLNTPYDETLISRPVQVFDFVVERVHRSELLCAISTHRLPVCFLI